jgi:exodeoxyribonuclease-3
MSSKIMSFNVNGLRSRLHQLKTVIDNHRPSIIALQETKVSDEEFPYESIHELGYHAEIYGQKGHYGVALLSQEKPQSIQLGFPGDDRDSQRRLIHGRYSINNKNLNIINGYFPQGDSRAHPTKFPAKRNFYQDLLDYLHQDFSKDDLVLVMGDMNVAPADIDVGIKPENAKRWLKTGKCAFLPEEREWLQSLLNWGLADSFRSHNSTIEGAYSWFDYRSRGFEQQPKRGLRIDLILASLSVMPCIDDTGIDIEMRGHEKPSDHCPVWVELTL